MTSVSSCSPSVSSRVPVTVFFKQKPNTKTQTGVMSIFNDLKLAVANLTNASSLRLQEHKSIVSSVTKQPEWLQGESISVELFLREFGQESQQRCAHFIGFKHIQKMDTQRLTQLYTKWRVDPSYCPEDKSVGRLCANLQAKLAQEADLTNDLIVRIQNIYTSQLGLLDHRRLGVRSKLPLDSYNLVTDRCFAKYQQIFEALFNSPEGVLPWGEEDLLWDESFIENLSYLLPLVKEKYPEWSLAHEQMLGCLPTNYPFRFPNLFKPTEKDSLEVADDEKYKSLVSLYVAYFNALENALDHLKRVHAETIESIELIKEMVS